MPGVVETLLSSTALPNLHPALVHFPIALAGAALLFDGASILKPRERWNHAAVALWWLAAAGGLATYFAGRAAADALGMLPPEVERAVGTHADMAWWALLSVVGVALLRTSTEAWSGKGRVLALVGLAAGCGVQVLIVRTADLGGALVYRHGVAVTSRARVVPDRQEHAARPAAESPNGDWSDVVRTRAGSWTWTPSPGDGSVLGRVLERPGGDARLEVEVLPAASRGIQLRVAGDGWLLLPERWEDVRVEADVDVSEFDGVVGLAVLSANAPNGFSLEVGPGGEVSLRSGQDEPWRALDRGRTELRGGPISLALSASKGHWKGFIGERGVVHAHGSLPKPRQVAFVLRGNGPVTISAVRITSLAPAEAHSHTY